MTHDTLVRIAHRARRHALPVSLALACLLLLPYASHAQDDQEQKPATSKPSTPKPAQQTPALAGTPEPRFNDNVKVDVTITDQTAAGKPIVKTVSALIADRQFTQIRTDVQVASFAKPKAGTEDLPGFSWQELPLYVDLRPEMSDATHVRLIVGLRYKTLSNAAEEARLPPGISNVTQQLNVFLESGKPLVISQSADAATDRKVTIEVKATVMK